MHRLVLSHLPFLVDNHLQPPGHRTGGLLEVRWPNVSLPHLLDGCDELWQEGDVCLVLQLLLHIGPVVSNRAQVWRVTWPVQNPELLLELLQIVYHHFWLVAGCPVLQKEPAFVDPHVGNTVSAKKTCACSTLCDGTLPIFRWRL